MKNKNTIYVLLLLCVVAIGFWGIPALVKKAAYAQDRYPFVYYSSLLREFCFTEFDGRKDNLHDASGRIYTREQFDSVMPLLNYRQLHSNGTMPDSIDGIAIDPRILRTKQVVFRYSPKDINTPEIGLYIMYESLPKRLNLESPGDVFRFNKNIEFIDIRTNKINEEKSAVFQSALEKYDYSFPAQWTSGNLNIRKPYDEGYFSLDADGKLFHLKMVNGKPYVKNTQINKQMEIAHFSILEVIDKRFYGFVFDKKGQVYILEENGGNYVPLKLDIDPLNLEKDHLMVVGNLLYWIVSVDNETGKKVYSLKTETLQKADECFIPAPENRWNKYAQWLFPAYLTFKNSDSNYIVPKIHFTGFYAFAIHILLLFILFLIWKPFRKNLIFNVIFVLLTGIAGAFALLITPVGSKRKNISHKIIL
ncbi:MAG: DUF4857 domain-containing protein [Dysgonamonadaceae bacterium]|jgi:hypothetical protein|nr:DUF4857 domain-containing protein [Dysgonamonadaceae bacterium]